MVMERGGMKLLGALLAIALSGIGLVACGGASKQSNSKASTVAATTAPVAATTESSSSASTQVQGSPPKDRDKDADNPTRSYFDKDDNDILAYGQNATTSDTRAMAAVVRRYYAAAVKDDGAGGCSAIYSLVAESIPEDYGQPPGPPSLSGKTCAVVMTKMFKQNSRQFGPDPARSRIIAARVLGNRGYAVLGAHTRPERYILMHREFGTWKVQSLVDSELP
jgi:hypothetical protein